MNASSVSVLIAVLSAGCASSASSSVAMERPFVAPHGQAPYGELAYSSPAPNQSPLETRHIYLFAPGKAPVLLVNHSAANSEQASAADLDERKHQEAGNASRASFARE